eukprot:jgi/Mesvir1/15286/Mv06501-RA.1
MAMRANNLYRLARRVAASAPSLPRQLGQLQAGAAYAINHVVERPRYAGVGFDRSISVQALSPSDTFPRRHNSITPDEEIEMAKIVGFPSAEALIDATVPKSIRLQKGMDLGKYTNGMTESQFLDYFKKMASKNKIFKSYIGMGYYNCFVPPVVQRVVLENPGWYTQYTPYQAEIAQGRLESLLNFQTLVTDLTGMPMSNASLLDEATAAAEAMTMCSAIARGKKPKFLVSDRCHPQTIAVCESRADGLGLEVIVGAHEDFDYSGNDVCGTLVQYPCTDGGVINYEGFIKKAHEAGVKVVMSTDLLSLTVLKSPGEMGADMVVGSAQRFGVPMGYGGPHAAFLATAEEYKRLLPGRIIGVSQDATGQPALRMAMQTREQHMAAMYAIYHGPQGLKDIATRVHGLASVFAAGVSQLKGYSASDSFFDTVKVSVGAGKAEQLAAAARDAGCNIRVLSDSAVSLSFDETTTAADVDQLFAVFNGGKEAPFSVKSLAPSVAERIPKDLARTSSYLTNPVFHRYRTEHELLRYMSRLQAKDLSLCHSMIPLGSCTMKLNATTEMMPVTWPELANIHPFVPKDQAAGYQEMFSDLADMLCEITGFDAMSLQPNSGASGEYAGLMAIRAFHQANGDHHRDVCIIPVSAHGTNPASAVMAGMKIIPVSTDSAGNIDLAEVKARAEENKDKLACLMVTYPSTHGVYEDGIREMCEVIHKNGGQVYMDGANMNAQVGLTSPGHIGADVCHLNLHKTFCIPHGGGGPGMGPIGVKAHLAPFLPSHPVVPTGGLPVPQGKKLDPFGCMAAAPYGSSLILPISFAYISLMGAEGLRKASVQAILNANYMAKKLENHYPILFRGPNGTNAHEFIVDLRGYEATAGIKAEDVAKRLMDYGYHAPTMSWPVSGTLMIEPTESESKSELDRFVNAMIAIREEIRKVENQSWPKDNNPLKNAPHPPTMVMSDKWDKPYSREVAAYPASWLKKSKFWPSVARVDNVFGDRKLVLTKPTEDEYPTTV